MYLPMAQPWVPASGLPSQASLAGVCLPAALCCPMRPTDGCVRGALVRRPVREVERAVVRVLRGCGGWVGLGYHKMGAVPGSAGFYFFSFFYSRINIIDSYPTNILRFLVLFLPETTHTTV